MTIMTNESGPVVAAERSITALLNIRHEWLLEDMFERVSICDSVAAELAGRWPEARRPEWVDVHPDRSVELPPRLTHVEGTDRMTLMLSVSLNARLTLIEGKPLLEKVKLSFIKSMGVIPLLVQAYQEGRIKRVKPLLIALERSGHEMPPPEQMRALLAALDAME